MKEIKRNEVKHTKVSTGSLWKSVHMIYDTYFKQLWPRVLSLFQHS